MTATAFQARLYGPELPVTGVEAEVVFGLEVLHIRGLAGGIPTLSVPVAQLTANPGGFEHHGLFLEWQDAAGRAWSLHTATPADTAIVMAQAPESLRRLFSHWQRRRRRIRVVWSTIASVTFALVIALGLLWFYYDETVAWIANQVPVKTEERLGNAVLQQLEAEGDIIKDGPAVAAIEQIGSRLTQGSAYQYRWRIMRDETVNAFAMPGGIVVVNAGLIREAESAEELAAVLAHEVQHVEHRHSLQSAIHSLGWAAGLMVVLGDVNVATAVIAHQLGNMYFSRDKEDQADREGYDLLVRNRIRPDGMASFFRKLQQKYPDGPPEWLSSHPDLAGRIAGIEQLLRERPCADCGTLGIDIATLQQDPRLLPADESRPEAVN